MTTSNGELAAIVSLTLFICLILVCQALLGG